MQNILITGSNRGIGLALVEQYLQRGDVRVFAGCRRPARADDLLRLEEAHPHRLVPVALDVNDLHSHLQAFDSVRERVDTLDVLINNAGIYPRTPETEQFGKLSPDALMHVVQTNAIAPVLVTQAFAPLLKTSDNPRVVMVSSRMGSIALTQSSNGLAYRTSKAAMNMNARVLAAMLRRDGIVVITTHPGHVQTDMGGRSAPVAPNESAQGLVRLIDTLSLAQSGSFFDWMGNEIPW